MRCLPANFEEAFGIRQIAASGFGAVLMNGVKRGLFSNEAGSGSAPCAAAAAESNNAVKIGLVQALGVFIDTIVICSCGNDHAVSSCRNRPRADRYGSFADCHELSSWKIRCCLYSGCHWECSVSIHRNPVLCPFNVAYLFRKQMVFIRRSIRFLHWSCSLSAVWLHTRLMILVAMRCRSYDSF